MATRPAHVDWLEWSERAFARAASEDKPILLALTAAWSQSCQEMDEASYSVPGIRDLVNRRFVPIRVDSDARPDINERYNLGGWPTTAFLTPDGELLAGATYLPPERLLDMLRQVSAAFDERRGAIADRAARARDRRRAAGAAPIAQVPDRSAVSWILDQLVEAFDPVHGGFGVEPKFPHPAALRLLVACLRDREDDRLLRMLTASLDAIGWRGLYDDVDGGFFRYSSSRDWTEPHLEKVLGENAALLDLYLEAWQLVGHRPYRNKSIDLIRYLHGTLADTAAGGFFASQRADEDYYRLRTAGGRREAARPPVDRSKYVDQNCRMMAAYIRAGELLEDPAISEFAINSLDRLMAATYTPGAGVSHEAAGSVRGLLSDQIAAIDALLIAAEASAREPYGMLAAELGHYCASAMWDRRAGGFFDRSAGDGPDALGLLRERVKPFVLDCRAAAVMIRLARATSIREFADLAAGTLAALAPEYRLQGPLAAEYGLAMLELESGG
jgi:uncharacterized protein YyaL (SSP411 family)